MVQVTYIPLGPDICIMEHWHSRQFGGSLTSRLPSSNIPHPSPVSAVFAVAAHCAALQNALLGVTFALKAAMLPKPQCRPQNTTPRPQRSRLGGITGVSLIW